MSLSSKPTFCTQPCEAGAGTLQNTFGLCPPAPCQLFPGEALEETAKAAGEEPGLVPSLLLPLGFFFLNRSPGLTSSPWQGQCLLVTASAPSSQFFQHLQYQLHHTPPSQETPGTCGVPRHPRDATHWVVPPPQSLTFRFLSFINSHLFPNIVDNFILSEQLFYYLLCSNN